MLHVPCDGLALPVQGVLLEQAAAPPVTLIKKQTQDGIRLLIRGNERSVLAYLCEEM